MDRLLERLMAAAIGAALMASSAGADETTAPQRFSIAVSGGASKGAYEAGLNWAALKLVRESADLKRLSGGRLRPMELVSVAGASAGGVNTLLSGLTWCARPESEGGLANRSDSNLFRDTWLRVDINALLPDRPDSETYLPDDALFSRKDYFASANELRKNWRKPAFRVGCKVPLGVTVTRVVPQELIVGEIDVKNQRFYIPFELRVQEDGSVAYFFDPADYPRLSDPAMILMPRPHNAPEFSISDELIIEAAAVTSAFPTGFGRRRVQYCRLEVRSSAPAPESDSEQSDTDLVCPKGYELDEAEFADGGLFDNLPVGLARILAELNSRAIKDPFPVTYLYLDPNRLRYETPDPPDKTACASDNPPEACRIMEFSFFSESGLLVGALGTARNFELYRETTSDNWRLNLSQLSYELAQILDEHHGDFDCAKELPYFDSPMPCAEAVRRAGHLLEIAFDRIKPEISPPYSPERLVEAGIADSCASSAEASGSDSRVECRIHAARYREQLAETLMLIIKRANIDDQRLYVSISRSRQSTHHDRALRVSSRGGPITGTLLADFGSFLDYKFRQYDYYVGIYDAIALVSDSLCGLQYSRKQQPEDFGRCVDSLGKQVYEAVGIENDAPGRYVFARLAEREFAKDGVFGFSYSPPPPVDRDMQIIHDGLEKALEAGEGDTDDDKAIFVTENTFFEFLKAENFVPTETEDGTEPLLAEIIADPDTWPTELTRRFTARLVHLERQAAKLYAAREPDPDLREKSYTTVLGATAHMLQSATYTYPTFTFSPSTAPEDWIWRYVIPYEVAFDMVEGDLLVNWQPTLALSKNNLLNLRAGLGFAGGLVRSSSSRTRENYLAVGLGYIRRTGSTTVSSFGFTPTWYHDWNKPELSDQNTVGGDIHVSFLHDRVRVGVGSRDFGNFNDAWFLSVGVLDVPGATYWLTR
jgi:predicted acylesterase/phospholipase RssA